MTKKDSKELVVIPLFVAFTIAIFLLITLGVSGTKHQQQESLLQPGNKWVRCGRLSTTAKGESATVIANEDGSATTYISASTTIGYLIQVPINSELTHTEVRNRCIEDYRMHMLEDDEILLDKTDGL